MLDEIRSFSGKYRFLSNFYPSVVMFDRGLYPTVEHAYQAAKDFDPHYRYAIRLAETPAKAKKLGQTVALRDDWENVKFDVMYNLVWQKFHCHDDLREKLLETGVSELVEGNTWNDTYWGVCKGKGSNYLGKILMRVRERLREDQNE